MGVYRLEADYGQGWMTAAARDLVRIAVDVAGFDAQRLSHALLLHTGRGMVNAATVERILGELDDDDHGPGCDGPYNCTCRAVR